MQFMKEKLQKANQKITELEQGSIIETVENSNGTAIKFADGTLLCYHTLEKEGFLQSASTYSTAQNIKIYRSQLVDWVYPIQFTSMPNIEIQIRNNANGTRFQMARPHVMSATHAQVQILGLEDFIENAIGYTNLVGAFVQAIGRWKN